VARSVGVCGSRRIGHNPSVNLCNDAKRISLHLCIAESQKSDPEFLQRSLAQVVVCGFESMCIAIDLNRQHQPRCEEIDNVPIDRALAVEIKPGTLARSEVLPE
jgi:hypothetical protein